MPSWVQDCTLAKSSKGISAPNFLTLNFYNFTIPTLLTLSRVSAFQAFGPAEIPTAVGSSAAVGADIFRVFAESGYFGVGSTFFQFAQVQVVFLWPVAGFFLLHPSPPTLESPTFRRQVPIARFGSRKIDMESNFRGKFDYVFNCFHVVKLVRPHPVSIDKRTTYRRIHPDVKEASLVNNAHRRRRG